jgi:hypothetical protein
LGVRDRAATGIVTWFDGGLFRKVQRLFAAELVSVAKMPVLTGSTRE